MSNPQSNPYDSQAALIQHREQQAAAAQQMAVADYQQGVERMIADGHERYGEANFDSMCAQVVDHIGEGNVAGLNIVLSSLDSPAEVVQYLSEHESECKQLARMNPQRAAAALSKIEQRLNPNANSAGNMAPVRPAWRDTPTNRQSPDKVLARDDVSDQQWEAAYRRKYGAAGFNPYSRYQR